MKRLGLRRFSRPTAPASNPDVKIITATKQGSGDRIRDIVDALTPKPPVPSKPSKGVALPLSPMQGLFLRHYLVCLNATEAAKLAGYSKKTAYSQGQRLLKHVVISEEIRKRRAKVLDSLDVTPERISRELARVGFANMKNYMRAGVDGAPVLDFSDLNDDQTAALQEVTIEEFKDGRSDKREVRRTKFKLGDKRGALELLAKMNGLLVEKHEHRHEHTVVGVLLDEIDQMGRGAKLIDQVPSGGDAQ